jgi:hypothetical protein
VKSPTALQQVSPTDKLFAGNEILPIPLPSYREMVFSAKITNKKTRKRVAWLSPLNATQMNSRYETGDMDGNAAIIH